MSGEVELISDCDGFAVIGNPTDIDRCLRFEGLASQDLGMVRLDQNSALPQASHKLAHRPRLSRADDAGDTDDPIVEERVHSVRILNADKVFYVCRLPLTGTNEELEEGLVGLADWIVSRARSRQVLGVA